MSKRLMDLREVGVPVSVKCNGCGRIIGLYFNGGELDAAECCGYRYALTYGDAPIWLEVWDEKDRPTL